MPFVFPKRNVTDTENRLILLYCVHALETVSEVQLWPFIASLDLMDYITVQLLLHELQKSGDLTVGAQALHAVLSLSDQGKKSLRLFENRIMYSDRKKIEKAAVAYRAELKKRRAIRAAYESAKEGEFHVKLSLRESDLPTLVIRVSTTIREYAACCLRAFEESLPAILTHLYSLTVDARMPDEHDSAALTLTVHSRKEYSVTACLPIDETEFELSLLLPTLKSATCFRRALSSPARRTETAEFLFKWLCANGINGTQPGSSQDS
jgi:hypothetical protein